MRIAARWIGWYSLLIAAVGIATSLVGASLQPGGSFERLSKLDSDRADVQRIIDQAAEIHRKVRHLR